LKTTKNKIGKQESKMTERKEKRKAPDRRVLGYKLHDENDEI
jgi:hypothetical protein